MSGEVEKIAAGLKNRLLREFLTLSAEPQDKPVTWSVRWGYRLERMGLARRTLLTDRTRLTPLGLAVRNHLRTHKGESA